jgi:hypothetical protein
MTDDGACLARLSRVTVLRGAALTAWTGAAALTGFLYRAGGVTPTINRDDRWAQYLVTVAERSVASRLEGYATNRTEHWRGWTADGVDPVRLLHKIYVSPAVTALTVALPVVFGVATDLRVPAWKVGADVAGLHRPDKIVLYLPELPQAEEAAYALADRLTGVPAQGVPFTGQIGGSGIVSRGCDVGVTSWRAVVCTALSEELVRCRATLGPAAPAERVAAAALQHLAGIGYDVEGWSPNPAVRELVRS